MSAISPEFKCLVWIDFPARILVCWAVQHVGSIWGSKSQPCLWLPVGSPEGPSLVCPSTLLFAKWGDWISCSQIITVCDASQVQMFQEWWRDVRRKKVQPKKTVARLGNERIRRSREDGAKQQILQVNLESWRRRPLYNTKWSVHESGLRVQKDSTAEGSLWDSPSVIHSP